MIAGWVSLNAAVVPHVEPSGAQTTTTPLSLMPQKLTGCPQVIVFKNEDLRKSLIVPIWKVCYHVIGYQTHVCEKRCQP